MGWNLEGFRMGWGGGYYDLYLKNFKGLKIGVGWEICKLGLGWQDPWDQ